MLHPLWKDGRVLYVKNHMEATAEQSHTVIVHVVGSFEIPMSDLIEFATIEDGQIVTNGDALREAIEVVEDMYTLSDATWTFEIDGLDRTFGMGDIRPKYVPTKWDEAMGSIISASLARHRK